MFLPFMNKIYIEMKFAWKYDQDQHWPYNGIVNDLYRSVQAEMNYATAQLLFNYSEFIGRKMLGTVGSWKKGDDIKAYREFTKKYVGYKDISSKELEKIFNDCRNGLAHEYFVKGEYTAIMNDPGNLPCGIEKRGNNYTIYIHTYFNHFVHGLEHAIDEGVTTF